MNVPQRPCDDAFDISDLDPSRIADFLSMTLPKSKVILFMGLPKTGKSETMQLYQSIDQTRTVSRWSRQTIMNMLGGYEETFIKYIERFEGEILNEFLHKEWSILCYEAIARRVTDRKKLLTIAKYYQATVLVFDGPPELISRRLKEAIRNGEKWTVTEDEVDTWVKDQWKSAVWPDHSEGWHSIYYVNTFGQEGRDWLKISTRRI